MSLKAPALALALALVLVLALVLAPTPAPWPDQGIITDSSSGAGRWEVGVVSKPTAANTSTEAQTDTKRQQKRHSRCAHSMALLAEN